MQLAQHHFQAQSRYFESAIHFALTSVFAGSYGLSLVELDEDVLWNGTATLRRASGIMPDGLHFDLGEVEDAPESLSVKDLFGGSTDSQVLHLAISGYRRRRANLEGEDEGGDARFRTVQVELSDETTGEDRRVVPLGARNFRLVLGDPPSGDEVSIPLAEIRPDGNGHFVLDPNFIPPCLQVAASPRLMGILRRVVDMMEAKVEAIRHGKVRRGSGVDQLASHELTSYWLTHAILSSLGPLRHHLVLGASHPRAAYQDLIRLAGALATFTLEADEDGIPEYNHRLPTEVFGKLERLIRARLDVVIREKVISVPLEQSGAHLFAARLDDARAIQRDAEWVLRVSSSATATAVISGVPRKVKICSAEDVMRLVADANPGLAIEHLPSPPTQVAPRVGSQYFRVVREGPSWQLVVSRSSVGVYVPDSFPGADLELQVVLP